MNDLEKFKQFVPDPKKQTQIENFLDNIKSNLKEATGKEHAYQDDDFLNECQPDKNKGKKYLRLKFPI